MPKRITPKPKARVRTPKTALIRKGAKKAVASQQRAHQLKKSSQAAHHRAEDLHGKVAELEETLRGRTERPPGKQPPPFRMPAWSQAVANKSASKPKNQGRAAVIEPASVLPFSVVGIGASAGGYEALSSFLRHLPTDTGMAFVVIQHLDPTHESKLTELLAKICPLPIRVIESGMQVEPNQVYVLPANASVSLSKGAFRLSSRFPPRCPMPIDVFFRSLAREQHNRAIGVVLSGTGSDGTLGLGEIKGMSGVTFAQSEESAKYFGMPGSAISAGAVDFILPPAEIAAEIARLAQHPYVARGRRGRESQPKSVSQPPSAEDVIGKQAEEIRALFNLLRSRTGVDFAFYKPGTLNRRIMRRMVLRSMDSVAAYVRYLHENPAEVEALFNDLLINVTGFFRDSAAFQILQKRILPRLVKTRPTDVPLRIWSCGCSTGEEAYSLGIVIAEFFEKTKRHFPVQIFASDLNERGIHHARAGIYHENILLDVSPERLRRYFVKANGFYQVSKRIRDMCIFARQNVVTDPPFSNLDLISCRNLLIYLTPILQKRVLPVFHYALKSGGFLMLGNSESVGDHLEMFEPLDKKHKIYAKKLTAYRPQVEFETPVVPGHTAPAAKRSSAGKPEPVELNLQQKVDRLIVSEYSPPAVVINAQMDVLQFRGKTGPYLEHQSGAASLNLLKMAHDDLALDLRRVVSKAIKNGQRAVQSEVAIRVNGKSRQLRLEVIPLGAPTKTDSFYLVVFHEVNAIEEAEALSPKAQRKIVHKHEARLVSKLRDELAATKESLQAIIEEQDATNEELKSANEETQSSNEELQSTNEELETAREELQSTNEELTTLNQELQDRNTELAQLNNDLSNLLSSVHIAILMLGPDLTIRRFTPTAEKVFNLIPSDIGRQLGDLNRNIHIPDLDQAIQEVIENLAIVEREVQDREGRWYSLRIRPYRTHENKIDGVVMMLFDIDELKRVISQTISLIRQPVLTLAGDFTVDAANEAFYKCFNFSPEDVERKSIYELGNKSWNIPRFRQLLDVVLPSHGEVRDFKVEHDFPELGPRSLVVNARRFYEEGRGMQLILVMIEDVTAPH